ncbi:hypothetical protein D9758_007762 [Tetrapyrgos nigripes]|uniref:Uncharacterized protein n=1 Tax=Tetrapyrgos nigripes TaxID=182062 RepID=A0A8H5G5M4_9AGAR|nr:hypothetical protein D9758_007762 [Tetrapyrgos nigripes]
MELEARTYGSALHPLLTLAVAALLVLVPFIARSIRQYLLKKETIIFDLPLMGRSRENDKKIRGAAVVCGGSLGGLLAARICADHFEKVYIVEPEAWLCTEDGVKAESWTQKNKRARVMQYHSTHGNLVPVAKALERLFPDLEDECLKSGISLKPADFHIFPGGHQMIAPYEEYSGNLPKTIRSGRRATETLIRRLTLDKSHYPNITQIAGSVVAVEADSVDPKYLKKVAIQRTETGLKENLDATLVIDCTGPARAGSKWLQELGFGRNPKPLEDLTNSYDPQMRYATFNFKMPSDVSKRFPEYDELDKAGGPFAYRGDPSHSQVLVGAAFLERNFVSVTCGTWGVSTPLPEDLEGLRECLKATKPATPIPDWVWRFLDVCQEVEHTLEINKVRCPPSFWTHFEFCNDLPANWIALGDSVCRVNPVYGQGGLKAVTGAAILNTILHDLNKRRISMIPPDFSSRFLHTQAEKLTPLWTGNKMVDYAYKTTVPQEGETLEVGSYIRWYLSKLEALCGKDKQVGSAMWHAMNGLGARFSANDWSFGDMEMSSGANASTLSLSILPQIIVS